jgi:hypothetical protein
MNKIFLILTFFILVLLITHENAIVFASSTQNNTRLKIYVTNLTIVKSWRTIICPTCPYSTIWSVCSGGKQVRTNYICNERTNYKCQSYLESRICNQLQELKPQQYVLVAAVIAIVLIIAYLGFKPKKVVMTGSKHRKKKRKA